MDMDAHTKSNIPLKNDVTQLSTPFMLLFGVSYCMDHVLTRMLCSLWPWCHLLNHSPRNFLSTIGKNPNVYKSNQLHVDIFQFFLIKLGYISTISLNQ